MNTSIADTTNGQNDNFDYKFRIFEEICLKANVPILARNLAYSMMLQGEALDYYYTNLRQIALMSPLDRFCTITKNYFEGLEYIRRLIAQ